MLGDENSNNKNKNGSPSVTRVDAMSLVYWKNVSDSGNATRNRIKSGR